MPNSIPDRHIKRIFPFAFFNELIDAGFDYYPFSQAFIAKAIGSTNIKELETIYKAELENKAVKNARKAVARANVTQAGDVFNEPLLLIASIFSKEELATLHLGQPELVNQHILAVQYYDTNHKPIFTKEMPIEVIRQIPELLWDDPNMLIVRLDLNSASSEEGQAAVLKMPKFLENTYLESEETPNGLSETL